MTINANDDYPGTAATADTTDHAEPAIDVVVEPKSGPRPVGSTAIGERMKLGSLTDEVENQLYDIVMEAGGIMLAPLTFLPEHIVKCEEKDGALHITACMPLRRSIEIGDDNLPVDDLDTERLYKRVLLLSVAQKASPELNLKCEFLRGTGDKSNFALGILLVFKITKKTESVPASSI